MFLQIGIMQLCAMLTIPPDRNDHDHDAKTPIKPYALMTDSKENDFPAVIIPYQVTKENFAAYRENMERVGEKKSISSANIGEISIANDEGCTVKDDTHMLDPR